MTLKQTPTNNEIYIEEIWKKDIGKYGIKICQTRNHPHYFLIKNDNRKYPITIIATENIYENEDNTGFELMEECPQKAVLEFSTRFKYNIEYHKETPQEIKSHLEKLLEDLTNI